MMKCDDDLEVFAISSKSWHDKQKACTSATVGYTVNNCNSHKGNTMTGIRLAFNRKLTVRDIDDQTLVIFPFKQDVAHFFEQADDDFAITGTHVISIDHLVSLLMTSFFADKTLLDKASRFAIAQTSLLEAGEFDENLATTFGITDLAIQLFVSLDEMGIFAEQDTSKLGEKTKKSVHAYNIFRKKLCELGFVTSGETFNYATNFFNNYSTENVYKNFIFNGIKKIFFSGFLEFTKIQAKFLRSLAHRFTVEICFPVSRHFFPPHWDFALQKLITDFDIGVIENFDVEKAPLLAKVLAQEFPETDFLANSECKTKLAFYRMPDVLREVEAVVRKCYLLCAQGIAPADILIAAPKPEDYSVHLAYFFDNLKLPHEITKNSYAGSLTLFLQKLVSCVNSNFLREEFFQLIEHPIFSFDKNFLREQKNRALENRLRSVSDIYERTDINDLKLIAKKLLNVKKSSSFTELIDALGELCAVRECTEESFENISYFIDDFRKTADLAQKFDTVWESAKANLPTLGKKLLLFGKFIEPYAEKKLIRGIRLSGIDESRFAEPKFAFFVGMNKDVFPPRHMPNALLDDGDQAKFFLANRAEVAKLSFVLAMENADAFQASYAAQTPVGNVAPSRPFDEIVRFLYLDNLDVNLSISSLINELRKYNIFELDNSSLHFDNNILPNDCEINTQLIDHDNVHTQNTVFSNETHTQAGFFASCAITDLSVSALEAFWKCRRLFWFDIAIGGEETNEPEEELDAADIGKIVHRSLKEFYVQRFKNVFNGICETITDVNKLIQSIDVLTTNFDNAFTNINFEEKDFETLSKVLREIFANGFNPLATENLAHTEKLVFAPSDEVFFKELYSSPEYIDRVLNALFALQQHFVPIAFEVKIKVDYYISDNYKIALNGRIDRIDIDREGNLRLVDYKTGKMHKYPESNQLDIYAAMLQKVAKNKICKSRVIENAFVHSLNYYKDSPNMCTQHITKTYLSEYDEYINNSLSDINNYQFAMDMQDITASLCSYCPYNNEICKGYEIQD